MSPPQTSWTDKHISKCSQRLKTSDGVWETWLKLKSPGEQLLIPAVISLPFSFSLRLPVERCRESEAVLIFKASCGAGREISGPNLAPALTVSDNTSQQQLSKIRREGEDLPSEEWREGVINFSISPLVNSTALCGLPVCPLGRICCTASPLCPVSPHLTPSFISLILLNLLLVFDPAHLALC